MTETAQIWWCPRFRCQQALLAPRPCESTTSARRAAQRRRSPAPSGERSLDALEHTGSLLRARAPTRRNRIHPDIRADFLRRWQWDWGGEDAGHCRYEDLRIDKRCEPKFFNRYRAVAGAAVTGGLVHHRIIPNGNPQSHCSAQRPSCQRLRMRMKARRSSPNVRRRSTSRRSETNDFFSEDTWKPASDESPACIADYLKGHVRSARGRRGLTLHRERACWGE